MVFRSRKEEPKVEERVQVAPFYIEGRRDPTHRRSATAKIDSLLRGQGVEFSEEDLNSLLEAALLAQRKAASRSVMKLETANVRVRAGKIHVGVEVRADLLGLEPRFFVQARGEAVAESGRWVFAPTELQVGALPLEKFPGALAWARERWLDPTRVYPELAAASSRIGGIRIEGDVIRITSR